MSSFSERLSAHFPNRLSLHDVERLRSDQTPEARIEIADKLARTFRVARLGSEQRRVAEDILRGLVKDTEVRVRQALAAQLKDSRDLPRELALTLARDIESVALPMLSYSEVLSDDDLIAILKTGGPAQQVAIAGRPRVSATVAEAVIDTGNETATSRLVANEGAELDERLLGRSIEKYGHSEAVSTALAQRPGVPAAITEQLMNVVTQQLISHMAEGHRLPVGVVRNLLHRARDRATLSFVSETRLSDTELEAHVAEIDAQGRLSTSLAFRALSSGDLRFFEVAMAQLAGIPLENTRVLLNDQGDDGLDALLRRALEASRHRKASAG